MDAKRPLLAGPLDPNGVRALPIGKYAHACPEGGINTRLLLALLRNSNGVVHFDDMIRTSQFSSTSEKWRDPAEASP